MYYKKCSRGLQNKNEFIGFMDILIKVSCHFHSQVLSDLILKCRCLIVNILSRDHTSTNGRPFVSHYRTHAFLFGLSSEKICGWSH